MLRLLAQEAPTLNIWNGESGSTALFLKIGGALIVGFGLMVLFLFMPTRLRRPVIAFFTFIAGAFFMARWIWPQYDDLTPEQATGFVEKVALGLKDTTGVVGDFSNILTAFLLGLGIYSIVSIHGKRILKRQRDWQFSVVLFTSIIVMTVFGYGSWLDESKRGAIAVEKDPSFWNNAKDLFFDGFLQNMDAAMFSLIAFFILSAAYRAFRIRSVESTILLSTALIVMLSLMGLVVNIWDQALGNVGGVNLSLTEIAAFIKANLQVPGIQAVGFGVGIATVAMAMRIWLSLERGGMSS